MMRRFIAIDTKYDLISVLYVEKTEKATSGVSWASQVSPTKNLNQHHLASEMEVSRYYLLSKHREFTRIVYLE